MSCITSALNEVKSFTRSVNLVLTASNCLFILVVIRVSAAVGAIVLVKKEKSRLIMNVEEGWEM